MNPRHQVSVASYAILLQEDKVLLMKRANTGYFDGYYSLPSGHIEVNEFPDQAVIRETKEEIGVDIIDPRFVMVMYTDDNYACFFFEVAKWDGEITNCEADKCDDLAWFAMDQLPENLTPEVKSALDSYKKRIRYTNLKILKSA